MYGKRHPPREKGRCTATLPSTCYLSALTKMISNFWPASLIFRWDSTRTRVRLRQGGHWKTRVGSCSLTPCLLLPNSQPPARRGQVSNTQAGFGSRFQFMEEAETNVPLLMARIQHRPCPIHLGASRQQLKRTPAGTMRRRIRMGQEDSSIYLFIF